MGKECEDGEYQVVLAFSLDFPLCFHAAPLVFIAKPLKISPLKGIIVCCGSTSLAPSGLPVVIENIT